MSSMMMETSQEQRVTPVLGRLCHQKEQNELDLSLCKLVSVPVEAIQLNYGASLTSLDLSHNLIASLSPRFIQEMTNLEKLDLSKNLIRKLPDDFGNLKQLTFFDIHCNKLETLPVSMFKLTQLRYLNITSNPLRPPLNKFLEMEIVSEESENYKITRVHPIITFLGEVATKAPLAEDAFVDSTENVSEMGDRYDLDMIGWRGLFHDFDLTEPDDEDDATNRNRLLLSSHKSPVATDRKHVGSTQDFCPVGFKTSFLRGSIYFSLLVLVTPVVVALMVDYTFFKSFAWDSNVEWWEIYNKIHQTVSAAVRCHCRLRAPLTVLIPHTSQPGFLAGIINSIYEMVVSVVTFFV